MKEAIHLGLVAVGLMIFINFSVAKKIGCKIDCMMAFTEKRISLISNIIQGIKCIKYMGWEKIFIAKIMKIRSSEFFYLQWHKYLDAFCVLFWAITSVVITTVTFISYIKLGYNIAETNIFSEFLSFLKFK